MSKNRLGQNGIFLGHFCFSAIALFMGISQNLGHFWAVLPIRTYTIYFSPNYHVPQFVNKNSAPLIPISSIT